MKSAVCGFDHDQSAGVFTNCPVLLEAFDRSFLHFTTASPMQGSGNSLCVVDIAPCASVVRT